MDFVLVNILLVLVATVSALGAAVVIFANAFGTATGGSADERPALVLGAVAVIACGWLFWRLWGPLGLALGAFGLWLGGAVLAFRLARDVSLLSRGLFAVAWPLLFIAPSRKWLLTIVDPEIPS